MRSWRVHNTYKSGFWGVAYGIERNLETRDFKGTQWFIHLGRKVWVFR